MAELALRTGQQQVAHLIVLDLRRELIELIGGEFPIADLRQEERKFRETVSFITGPGYLKGGDSRKKAGLPGGPSRVITDKAIFGFDPETKSMTLTSIHPGTRLDDVLANMGFRPLIPKQIQYTEPPTSEQLRLIREEIDPERMYMG